jgi:hypothetical protein
MNACPLLVWSSPKFSLPQAVSSFISSAKIFQAGNHNPGQQDFATLDGTALEGGAGRRQHDRARLCPLETGSRVRWPVRFPAGFLNDSTRLPANLRHPGPPSPHPLCAAIHFVQSGPLNQPGAFAWGFCFEVEGHPGRAASFVRARAGSRISLEPISESPYRPDFLVRDRDFA